MPCAILILARLSMNNFYLTVLFFSFFFKSFLVLYADRGLVQNGQANLLLFNQLYWLVVLSFLAFVFGVSFGPNILKGDYILHNTNRARACLLGQMPQFSSENHTTKKAIGTTLVMLLFCRMILSKWQVSSFMRRLCPNGRFSCVGKFKRNVIDIKETFLWLVMWCFASFICCLSVDYGRNVLSVQAQFWIWNTSEFLCYEGLHFFLPFLLSLPCQGRQPAAKSEFYVRKPSFEPDRLKLSDKCYSTGIGKDKGKGKNKNKVKYINHGFPSDRKLGESHIIYVSQCQCIPGGSEIVN